MIAGGYHKVGNWKLAKDVVIYNIETNSYEYNKPAMPAPRRFATIFLKDNFIYVVGGRDDENKPGKAVFRVNTNFQSTWETLPEINGDGGFRVPVIPYN